MDSDTFGLLFEDAIKSAQLTPVKDTPYFSLASEILEMAVSYRSDGITFKKREDYVNSHASYAYGFGWLDYGFASGLLTGAFTTYSTRLPVFDETIQTLAFDKLFEKTNRYERMLSEASGAVAVGTDCECPLYRFGDKTINDAASFLESGRVYLADKKYVNALAHFSYGYGILDACVRCGILIITDDEKRHLFTV